MRANGKKVGFTSCVESQRYSLFNKSIYVQSSGQNFSPYHPFEFRAILRSSAFNRKWQLSLCQNETLADEFRLCTCFELANNRVFYRKHPVLVNTSVTYHRRDGLGVMSVETLSDIQVRLMFMQSMALKRHLTMKS